MHLRLTTISFIRFPQVRLRISYAKTIDIHSDMLIPMKKNIKTAYNGKSIPPDVWDVDIKTIKFLKMTQKNRCTFPKNKRLELHR